MDSRPVRTLALAAGTFVALCAPAAAAAPGPNDNANDRAHEQAAQPTTPPAAEGAGQRADAGRPEDVGGGGGGNTPPADPPGNNGTIKVDQIPIDDIHPNNEPHVDCTFGIDFYGFDEGEDFEAHVIFEGHAPTGGGVLVEDTVFIGEDGNEGGGSEAGIDASRTYDLSDALAGIEPQDQHGWHVKLTIHADGSQGADTKHKVFWVDGCRPESDEETPPLVPPLVPPVLDTTVVPPADVAPQVVTPPPAPEGLAPQGVLGNQVVNTAAAPAAEVLGVQQTRPQSLARTGTPAGLLAALGAGLVLAGTAVRRNLAR